MVKFEVWEEFEEAAKQIFLKAPRRTRYSVKHRPADGVVVVTVTDDAVKAKYETYQSADLSLIEKLTGAFGMWSTSTNVESTEDLLREQERLEEEIRASREEVRVGLNEEGVEGNKASVRGGGRGRGRRKRGG